MRTRNYSFDTKLRLVLAAGGLFVGACGLQDGMELPSGQDDGAAPDDSGRPVSGEEVSVRLLNGSEFALDVELYVVTVPDVATPEGLFGSPEHEYRDGIGFLSLGVLAPNAQAEVRLPCGEALFVGTTGGEFLDAVSGESVAEGTRTRHAMLGPQFDCGDRLTFQFFPDDAGEPNVLLRVD